MIQRENMKDVHPLSPMQEALLFQSISGGDPSLYVEQISYRVRGRIDLAAFQGAWNRMVERYDILRTVFVYKKPPRPLQVVLKKLDVEITVADLTGEPRETMEERVAENRRADRERGFEFGGGPLMRIKILLLPGECWEVIWSRHHILMDDWCRGVIQAEFTAVYNALMKGEEAVLPETRPYADYIRWLERRDPDTSLMYWRRYLEGVVEPSPLPLKRGTGERSGRAVEIFHLTGEFPERVAALGERHGVTMNTLFQAAWGLLLCRYNDRNDVVFGTVVSGRPKLLGGVESMVGLFINTVPVRVTVGEEDTAGTLLKRLRKDAAEGEFHHYTPLGEILAQTPLKGELIDHIMVFENYPLETEADLGEGNFTVESAVRFERTGYPFLVVVEPGEEIHVGFHYDPSVYTESRMKCLGNHLLTLLENLVEEAGEPVLSMEILSPGEEERLLFGFEPGEHPALPPLSVHRIFEAGCEKWGNATALRFKDRCITYGGVNRMANRLARVLLSRGVAGTFVGIHMERSVGAVISMLAVLKAGGAYLPLDPAYPEKRLVLMLDDASVTTVVTDMKGAVRLPEGPWEPLIFDAEGLLGGDDRAADNLPESTGPLDPAYVIYTSGAEGLPKGVVVPHGAVTRLVFGGDYLRPDRKTVMAHASNLSLDAATFEIWGALLGGGLLSGIEPEVLISPGEFTKALRERGITTLHITTALFNQVADHDPSAFGTLSALLFGGEAADPERVRKVMGAAPPGRLLHVYGPTENTTFSTWHPVREVPQWAGTIPIGKALAGGCVRVLDSRMRPSPIGVPGEIYLGGEGLARGYLCRPDLTEERFIPDPHAPGERLYRTGDMGRRMEDGSVEFIGRGDDQVKIRGFRIEPGEVEACLGKHPLVEEAVVMCRGNCLDRELVAFAVMGGPGTREENISILRAFLKAELPHYMVPARFVIKTALPVNVNGKIDRKRLEERMRGEIAPGTVFVPPRTDDEVVVAAIWGEILGLPRVGRSDNFFELGGHSLKAGRVIAGVVKELRVNLPIRSLLDNPELSAFCEAVSGREKG